MHCTQCIEEIKAAICFAIFFEQLNDLPLDVCRKLIKSFGKGEINGTIKKAPALGLNGDMKLEGYSGNGGDMKPEVDSGNGERYNIEPNNGSFAL